MKALPELARPGQKIAHAERGDLNRDRRNQPNTDRLIALGCPKPYLERRSIGQPHRVALITGSGLAPGCSRDDCGGFAHAWIVGSPKYCGRAGMAISRCEGNGERRLSHQMAEMGLPMRGPLWTTAWPDLVYVQ